MSGLRISKNIQRKSCQPHLHATRVMQDSAEGGAALVDAHLRLHAVIDCKS